MEQITLTNAQIESFANSVADKVIEKIKSADIPIIDKEEYVSPATAAKMFGVSQNFLRGAYDMGLIKGRSIGLGKKGRINRRLSVRSVQECLQNTQEMFKPVKESTVNALIQKDLSSE